MDPPDRTLVLSDLPLGETAEFNFERIIHTMREFISSAPKDAPFSIRVSGGWGTGKTTLLKGLESAFESEEEDGTEYVTIWFDPWKLASEEEVRNALARSVLKVIEDDSDFATNAEMSIERKNVIRMLSERLLNVKADEVNAFYRAEAKMRDTFVEVEDIFQRVAQVYLNDATQPRRLVIFVDDLDRCRPGRVTEVLESIKLFFDLPGLIFVFALDSSQLERAVGVNYEMSPAEAREYLEKIFQLTIQLPRKKSEDLRDFLATNLEKIGVELENEGLYAAIVDRFGRNLRQLKIFINWFSFQRQLIGEVGALDEESLFRWLYLETTMDHSMHKAAGGLSNLALALEFLAHGGFLHDEGIRQRYLAQLDGGELNYVALIVYSIVAGTEGVELPETSLSRSQMEMVKSLQEDGEVIPTLKVLRESTQLFIDMDMAQMIYLTRNADEGSGKNRSVVSMGEAEKLAAGALATGSPYDAADWDRLGDQLIRTEKLAEAYLCYLMATSIEPTRAAYICDVARAFTRNGVNAVRELHRRAYSLDPDSAYVLVDIAVFNDISLKNEELGSLLYRKALIQNTPTSIVPYYLAMNLEKEGKFHEAYLACLDAAIREPDSVARRERLADNARRAGLPVQPNDRPVEELKAELAEAVAAGAYPLRLTPEEEELVKQQLSERPDQSQAAEELSRPPF